MANLDLLIWHNLFPLKCILYLFTDMNSFFYKWELDSADSIQIFSFKKS